MKKRILAHKIIYQEIEYDMSIAEIEGDRVVKIEPFVEEIASTVFFSGTITLSRDKNGKIRIIRSHQ